MKIISWNVNGLRACMNKGFGEFLNKENPDIICVQETKMQKEQANFNFEGYFEYWNSAEKKGYSGTAIFSKTEPLKVTYNIENHTDEGRVITAEYENFYLVCVYTPNAQPELKRIDYRMQFEDDLRNYLKNLKETKPVILCGDLNVAHKPIDLKNPKQNIGNPGYSYEERGKMTELLSEGFIDTFRYFYPEKENAYSWWSYRSNARQNNVGWRIDYFIVSDNFEDKLEDSLILPEVMGSDHCPVMLKIK
ncbi:MAG: exodeoxyribonuclease III [Ruminococcaceae bacterium]|nr:exodeoxyribonuclease III [Oscillospiraceae bacterium]